MRLELNGLLYSFRRSGIIGLCAAVVLLGGCENKPTFPGDQAASSVEKINHDVFKLESQADLKGRTLGVLWTTDSILDEAGKSISKNVNEIIGNLSQAVVRVALSTDRPIDFIVVAVRGLKEEMELRVVRSVDDVRRAQAEALSVTESMNRTLFQQLPVDAPTGVPAKPFDTGEWTLEEFLSKQVLQRVRMSKPVDPQNPMPTELYDGKYFKDEKNNRVFEFSILTFKQENSKDNILDVLRTVRDVIVGYQYDNFDQIVIRDLIHNRRLVIGRSTMKIFEAKQISEEDLLKTRLVSDTGRPSAFKNALEVFGFNIS